jgi:hypothetical protein
MTREQSYFTIDVKSPAEEGDGWQYVDFSAAACADCGRRPLPYRNSFHVPDDMVIRADVGVWGFTDDPLLECAGILLVREDVADVLVASGLTGFELQAASVSRLDDELRDQSLPDYRWVVVTGRCDTTPIWERVVGRCDTCGTALAERVERTTRSWALQSTHPSGVDICRAREASAGLIVSGRFKDVLFRHDPRAVDVATFKPVAFAESDGGSV